MAQLCSAKRSVYLHVKLFKILICMKYQSLSTAMDEFKVGFIMNNYMHYKGVLGNFGGV